MEKKQDGRNGKADACRPKVKRRKTAKCSMYSSTYLKKAGITARAGKQAYISVEHHEWIRRIVQLVGHGEISITDYIHNVLAHHFEECRDEITEIINDSIENIRI